MEYLINRPQIVSKVYAGYADPGNGAGTGAAGSPWASPLEKSGGPYPYSPSEAIALLQGARLEGRRPAARPPASTRAPGPRTAAPGSPRASR